MSFILTQEGKDQAFGWMDDASSYRWALLTDDPNTLSATQREDSPQYYAGDLNWHSAPPLFSGYTPLTNTKLIDNMGDLNYLNASQGVNPTSDPIAYFSLGLPSPGQFKATGSSPSAIIKGFIFEDNLNANTDDVYWSAAFPDVTMDSTDDTLILSSTVTIQSVTAPI